MKKIATILVVAALVGGVLLGLWGAGSLSFLTQSSAKAESRSSEVINSVTREEQVVLLSLGIQGVEVAKKSNGDFGWIKIPGTERKSFLIYSFDAKLGIEGKDVEITEVGDNNFLVTIPEFIFIGYKVRPFESAIEENGALSWMTESIDATEMINQILGDEKRDDYIASNEEALKEQAESFYSRIISSLAPDAVIEFTYSPA